MANKYREVAVSEFFEKNKHLLGFDNPVKALFTVVKEGVDNSLDAAEEAGILPEIYIQVKNIKEDIFEVTIEDNGPGIEKKYVKDVFGRLLYGSKFKSLGEEGIQSRGQQGIGISASILYAQLTTGKSTIIESKVKNKAHYSCKLIIDTSKNIPVIKDEKELNTTKEHGTKIVLTLKGTYRKTKSIDDYIKYTSITNPHAKIVYVDPEGKKHIFRRVTEKLPKMPKTIKPHPHGIELGTLIKMLGRTKSKTVYNFLRNDFSKVGDTAARDILFAYNVTKAGIKQNMKPADVTKKQAEELWISMQKAKLQRPPTDCLSPIGEQSLIKGLSKEYKADFVTACTRPVAVYRAIPFQVEVGLLYSQELDSEKSIDLVRYANKVPILYQQSECAIYKAVIGTQWRRYGLNQSKGSLPIGPVILIIHIASVWVPFISEGKQAIAGYPEIIKEIKLALAEVGRKLNRYLSAQQRRYAKERRMKIFHKYSVEVANAVSELTNENRDNIENMLKKLIEREGL
jgi:DNA topoisomerase-6 subunit B